MARRPLSPAQVLALSFVGLIGAGTLLLSLPAAAETGQAISTLDAFFTATSAVCVTGLIVVDTPRAFSTFGELVLLGLIQAGGLGYMTLSTLFAILVGKRLSFHERLVLQESLNLESREGLVRFVRAVARTTFVVEAVAAAALTVWWAPRFGLWHSAYLSVFHSISAFNNAGFSLFSDNLVGFRNDLVVNLIVAALITAGGLGFLVLRELGLWLSRSGGIRSLREMSLHTRLVLLLSSVLTIGATLTILVFERTNPKTLGSLPWGEAVLASFFQAVTPRTAGFNTVDIGAMLPESLFLLMALMFIGASPGGTGGGVKTTTFGITVAALWATVRGRHDVVLFKRRLSPDAVARAFFISLIAFLVLNLIAGFLLIHEDRQLMPTLFEATSAFGTVGLSMGQTGSVLSLSAYFDSLGKLLIIALMFIGRVGPLTLAIAVVSRKDSARLRYPEGKVMIG